MIIIDVTKNGNNYIVEVIAKGRTLSIVEMNEDMAFSRIEALKALYRLAEVNCKVVFNTTGDEEWL